MVSLFLLSDSSVLSPIMTYGILEMCLVSVTFEEADLASLPPPPSPEEGVVEVTETTTPTQTTSSMMHLNITGIFRRKKKKKNANEKVSQIFNRALPA